MSEALRAELARVASRFGADGVEFVLERPRDAGHGDLATNLAMVLARRERANPRKTAERVLEELNVSPALVARTEIAGPGFINFWLAQDQLAAVHRAILQEALQPLLPTKSLKDLLLEIPDVGDDEDFGRPLDLGRDIDL